ncbi:MAG: S46 family peptidase [Thermoanaerobaculia bacterium]|nr:S46 family peptidase [Thermoanaerobaculia bacterium]
MTKTGLFRAVLASVLLLSPFGSAVADEGMWTLDNFPREAVEAKYGVEISDDWLATVQQAVTRLEGGCTGSFVSSDGLVLTNHHCARGCISQNSTPERNLEAEGFLAANREEEIPCPSDQISFLKETEEITDAVEAAVAGKSGQEAGEARRQALTRLEQECEEASGLKCESVSLYQGGEHWLYKYERYEDVRLVFAPETDIAAFGGDPDNFNFPRWCLDMTLLRVYEDGEPASTPVHLDWRVEGLEPGEAVFVAGHPGSTQRLLTVDDLKFLRDVTIPHWLLRYVELRGRLIEYAKTGDEAYRTTRAPLMSIENGIKVYRKRLDALHEDALFEMKRAEEEALKAAVAADPELAAEVGSAWEEIERANEVYRSFRDEYLFIEAGVAFRTTLFDYARHLVRAAAERGKPNEERLREYTEAALPQLEQLLLAPRPIYPELEEMQLAYSLDKMREFLGPDSKFVHQILGKKSPEALAEELVTGTELADPEYRKALWEGGQEAIAASDDPMIELARSIDDEARALRKRYEDEVEAVQDRAYEKIARARFAVEGTDRYPDATFTLRVTYGAHEGWVEKGDPVRPWTTVERLYERATGEEPFRLPESWVGQEEALGSDTKFNFVATTDIIGGNSGSPAIDSEGRLVGLVFDGNIHSISGSYWFDLEKNRTVAVHPEIMIESLETIYGADRLVEELLGE